jgi:hypothetical protein
MPNAAFNIRNPLTAKKVAKLLKAALEEHSTRLPYHACLDIVAKMYGYPDWNVLERSAGAVASSPFDSEAGSEVAEIRLARHISVLQEATHVSREVAADVVGQIRPTEREGAAWAPFTDDEFFGHVEHLMKSLFEKFKNGMADWAIVGTAKTREIGQILLSSDKNALEEPMRISLMLSHNKLDRYGVFYKAILLGSDADKTMRSTGQVVLDDAAVVVDGGSTGLPPGDFLWKSRRGELRQASPTEMPERVVILVCRSRAGSALKRVFEIQDGPDGPHLGKAMQCEFETDYDNLFSRTVHLSEEDGDLRVRPGH